MDRPAVVDVHVHVYPDAGPTLARIEGLLQALIEKVDSMSTDLQTRLDALVSTVTEVEGTEQSAIVALQGITTIVQGLRDDLQRLGVTPEQLAAVDDATARLNETSTALAAAVAANPGT